MTTQPTNKKSPGTPDQFEETPPPALVNKFHTRSDVDSKIWSQHHTLGIKATQASPGDHNHDGSTSKILSGGTQPTLFTWGAWTTISGLVNCGAYGSGFSPPQYRISNAGDVQIRGLLSASANPNLTIPGAAPKSSEITLIKTQAGYTRMDMAPSGANAYITFAEPGISGGWFSISNVQWSIL